jgi:dipeptide/tripeptide permease
MAQQVISHSPSDSIEEKAPEYAPSSAAEEHPYTYAGREGLPAEDYPNKPTEEDLDTLRRVPGSMPYVAYAICAVEFAERASYYGVQPLINNFVNKPLPAGGNGFGAVKKGTQDNAGALGLGTVKASAVSQSFSMLAYGLPLLFGYLADTKTGRFKLICYGVGVFGIAHILMVGATAPSLLRTGAAVTPYLLSVYILSIGAGK